MMKSIFLHDEEIFYLHYAKLFVELVNEKHFSTWWLIFLLHDDEYFLQNQYEKIFYTFKIFYDEKYFSSWRKSTWFRIFCYIVKKFYYMMKNIFLRNEKHSFLHYEKYLFTLWKIFYRDNGKYFYRQYENYFSTRSKMFFIHDKKYFLNDETW